MGPAFLGDPQEVPVINSYPQEVIRSTAMASLGIVDDLPGKAPWPLAMVDFPAMLKQQMVYGGSHRDNMG